MLAMIALSLPPPTLYTLHPKPPLPTSLVGAGSEPDVTNGDPAAGDLTVHQQAGETAAAAGP